MRDGIRYGLIATAAFVAGCSHVVPQSPTRSTLPPVGSPGTTSVDPRTGLEHVPVSRIINQPAGQSATYYEVQPGDTLAGVAAKYGVPAEKLISANGLDRSATLQPKQLLFIPQAGSSK